MEWVRASKCEDGKLDVPGTWLLPHYYEALTVLFRVENALRLFVYVVLKERHGPKWRDLEISSDEEGKTTIAALAKRRIEQGRTFGYLTYPIQSPLMHLTSGELIGLITHDSYWSIFNKYFPAARNVVTLKLQEIGTVRNALAHFRPVSANDVEIVKLNADQMLAEVEKTLIELIECAHAVPTNTEDEWYKSLRTLGSDHVTLAFTQSRDESWIRVALRYRSVLVSEIPKETRHLRYRVTTVDTPAVVDIHQTLKNHVLFATERLPASRVNADFSLDARKEIGLTFSRRTLAEGHVDIKACLENVLSQISEETDLLREDQLARGKLVSVTSVTAKRQEQGDKWWVVRSGLRSAVPERELPEYWSSISAAVDFVSDTEDYPWMPVKICEGPVPF